jgi:hypothetical protein
VSSYTGENARKLRRPASRRSAPKRAPARAFGSVPCDGRYFDLGASRLALTCPRRALIRRLEVAPSPGPVPVARGGTRGCRSTGRPVSRKSAGALPEGAKASTAVDRAEAGGRAVKHAAAGGRMTARWSGVDPGWIKVATPLLPRDRPRKPTAVSLLTAAGRQSPEVVSISSARDVSVGCRNGVEAS